MVEPLLPMGAQREAWTVGFGAFGVAAVVSAAFAWRLRDAAAATLTAAAQAPVSWPARLRWLLLAAVPSSLMLGVTNYLSTDIAAVPLLWVGPLALYLLSFVLAFGAGGARWTKIAARRLPLLAAGLAAFMAAQVIGPLWLVLPLHLLTFAVAGLACHGRLAAERPAASSLTEYYFWLALGGTLGGAFNTFAAPLLFNAVIEYPIALVLAVAIAATTPSPTRVKQFLGPAAVGVMTATLLGLLLWTDAADSLMLPALGIPTLMAFRLKQQPVLFASAIAAMLTAAALVVNPYGRVLETDRTFFGLYRVTENETGTYRYLYHGTTLHGVQATGGPDRGEPLTYYTADGPFGQAFAALPVMRETHNVAVIGLGIGSLAAYARSHQRWTFYEIDPAVERIARTAAYFTHLEECGNRCRVVLGDARLSLTSASGKKHGVLVLDAFSSDAIPVHLITREALGIYLQHLSEDGVLAFHISNRHLNLGPVIAALAADAGLAGVEQWHEVSSDRATGERSGSRWAVLSRDERTLEPLLAHSRWTPLERPTTRVWTDDYSNILGAIDRR
jgi:hypothetical protein